MLKTKQTKIVLLPSLQEVTSYLQQIANATNIGFSCRSVLI